jgi:hypothetical protein
LQALSYLPTVPSTTHEVIISLWCGVDTGEIAPAQYVRLSRHQKLFVAESPADYSLYRQASADLQQMQREEH